MDPPPPTPQAPLAPPSPASKSVNPVFQENACLLLQNSKLTAENAILKDEIQKLKDLLGRSAKAQREAACELSDAKKKLHDANSALPLLNALEEGKSTRLSILRPETNRKYNRAALFLTPGTFEWERRVSNLPHQLTKHGDSKSLRCAFCCLGHDKRPAGHGRAGSQTTWKCYECNITLCRKCFKPFHTDPVPPSCAKFTVPCSGLMAGNQTQTAPSFKHVKRRKAQSPNSKGEKLGHGIEGGNGDSMKRNKMMNCVVGDSSCA